MHGGAILSAEYGWENSAYVMIKTRYLVAGSMTKSRATERRTKARAQRRRSLIYRSLRRFIAEIDWCVAVAHPTTRVPAHTLDPLVIIIDASLRGSMFPPKQSQKLVAQSFHCFAISFHSTQI
jgi:hypothetical protein